MIELVLNFDYLPLAYKKDFKFQPEYVQEKFNIKCEVQYDEEKGPKMAFKEENLGFNPL